MNEATEAVRNRPRVSPDYNKLPPAARIREWNVLELIGRSRASLWRGVRDGSFPAPKKHGAITTWRYGDVRKWMEGQA